MSFGNRLREERSRLGLTQEALGEIGGVRKQAQLHYEKDERKPDSDYLAAVAEAGVDILYVVTGERSKPVPPKYEPPSEETELLSDFRICDAQGRAIIRAASKAAARAANAVNPVCRTASPRGRKRAAG